MKVTRVSGCILAINRAENLGYTAAPDENINEYTICQPYVYEDGRSTGMRMIANLPLVIAFTNQSGIPTDSILSFFPPIPVSPRLTRNPEMDEDTIIEPPPPDYEAIQITDNQNEKCDNEEEFIEEIPPPTYDECMQNELDNVTCHI